MKAVIFDLDGTIVFSHPIHFAAYEELFGRFGIKWSFEEFEKVFAGTGAPMIIQTILARHGIKDFDLKKLVTDKKDIFNKLLEKQQLKTVPGFFQFLSNVNMKGLRKIIASGSNKANILHMLKAIGAEEEFPEVISGEEVSNPKPAPDIFLAAAEKIAVPPAECIVFEDTQHGIRGAIAAGMKCVALTTTETPDILEKAGAYKIATDYTEIDLNSLM